jgi:hypothetical protein
LRLLRSGDAGLGRPQAAAIDPGQSVSDANRDRTIVLRSLSARDIKIGALLYPERGYWRPQQRADCIDAGRPCPYVGCKYNLYLSVKDNGSLTLTHPGQEVWDARHSCALDLADEGGLSQADVSRVLGVTRERVRQIEEAALEKARAVKGLVS